MKNVLALCLTLTIGGTAFGLDDHHLQPVPDAPGGAVELFGCVKYKDCHEMAPCAVPRVISVPDPCASVCRNECECNCQNACECNNCCEPKCVWIQICVPKTCCDSEPEITSRWWGTRIEYDYGKYEIDVRIKDGYIEVDYQD